MNLKTVPVLAAAMLVAAPAARAHVTVNPNQAAAGSFARFDLRVPNEEADADTVKVTVQLPKGLNFTSFQPKAGWTRTVTKVKLAQPVQSDDGPLTERIATVTWSGGKIGPGEFDEFGFSAQVPDKEGEVLVFPAVQTYSDGHVARWIGAPDADEPAPSVTLTAAKADHHGSSATTTTPSASADTAEHEDNGRANVGIVLGAAGLAAGVAALGFVVAGRRRS